MENGRDGANRPRLAFIGPLVLITALLAVALVVAGDDVGDAGGDIGSATEISPGTWNGTIYRNSTEEDTSDFYRLPFDGGSVVVAFVTLDGSSTTHLDVHFRVFDNDQREVVSFDFPRLDVPKMYAVLTTDNVSDPSYYLAVTWDGSSLIEFRVNYTLDAEAEGGPQDDAGTGSDAPRSIDGAVTLPIGEHRGSVGGPDDGEQRDVNADGGDVYLLVPEEGQFLRVHVTLDEGSQIRDRNLMVTLENATGRVLDKVTVAGEGETASIRHFPKGDGDLLLNVTSSAVINNYTLVIAAEVPGADGDGRADAGDGPDHAMDVSPGVMPGTVMRAREAEDLADWYELELPSSRFVEASLVLRSGTVSTMNVRFRVLDRSKAEVVNFTFPGLDEAKRYAALTNSGHPTLRYYLGVTWEGDEESDFNFNYELMTSVDLSQDDMGTGGDVTSSLSKAPTVERDAPITGSVGGLSPQWSDDLNVDGADVYQVQPDSRMFVVVKARLDAFSAQRRVGFDVRIEDQAGNLLVKPDSLFEVGNEVRLVHYSHTTLPVYVVVSSESEYCNYTLVVSMETPPEIDLFVANLSVTPGRPEPGDGATITVVVGSTMVIGQATQVRVEVFVGVNNLEHVDVIFDGTDQAVATLPWTVPSTDTTVTAQVDTLDAVPWDPDKDNNEMSIDVKVGPDTGNGEGDQTEGLGALLIVLMLVAVIIIIIVVAVVVVILRGQEAEDEGPEDY